MTSTYYEKLLFNEMRLFPIRITSSLTDERMIKAMTLSENIRSSLGIALIPEDIIKFAKSDDMDTLYNRLVKALGEVKAKPMYPDFPHTVMNMEEAEFRFHQYLHYFSTYGIEDILGVEMTKGWLPSEAGLVSDTEKTEVDALLIPEKTIELIDVKDQYMIPLKKIVSKRNRMTLPENEILIIALEHSEDQLETICQLDIPFKENLMPIFDNVLSLLILEVKSDQILKALHALCQHTGDVFTCIRYALGKRHYRMRTAERKICVKLLESYPIADFKANMILSNKKSLNTHIVLNYISYNQYSRSEEHKQAVKDFRDGKLHSWESQMKYLLSNDKDHALDFIAQRPGMLLRMVAWLTRLGFDSSEITEKLLENVESLSVQTLVTILDYFGNYENIDLSSSNTAMIQKAKEYDIVYDICFKVLTKRITYLDTPIKDKKIYIKEGQYAFDKMSMEFNKASQDGGYIRSGTVFKIPEDVQYLRFFVYWNDNHRVDVDLHVYLSDGEGNPYSIGWNAGFRLGDIAFSGDITHSNAAEYVDMNMKSDKLHYVIMNIHLYAGKFSFGAIDECFIGLMAVNSTREYVQLYDPKNCLITHDLKNKYININYGFIDVQNKLLHVLVKNKAAKTYMNDVQQISQIINNKRFTLSTYLNLLIQSQHCELVKNEEVK
ncbi:MAG: hypothetical protein LUG12_03650 [Erysipelotrichaceae bacterium]|nr:hypothetical protein [Erysipelotrichaceae bacterium]